MDLNRARIILPAERTVVALTEPALITAHAKMAIKWPPTEHVSTARYKTWRRVTITKFVRSTELMRVAVSAAAQIGTSTKTAAGIVRYANRRKRLTDTMIAYARTGMIAAPHVAEKMRLVLTARLVVRRHKCVKTRCLPFVAPTAKPVSTEAAKKAVRQINRFLANPAPIRGVAQKDMFAALLRVSAV